MCSSLASLFRIDRCEKKNDSSIQNNDFILYPTDLLCGNLQESPLAYYGFQAWYDQHITLSSTREIPVQTNIDQGEMRNYLRNLHGRRGIIVSCQLDSLFKA